MWERPVFVKDAPLGDAAAGTTGVERANSGTCVYWACVEIGVELFLSHRTDEWHLSKVFGKLGIAARRDLRAALYGDPATVQVLWSTQAVGSPVGGG